MDSITRTRLDQHIIAAYALKYRTNTSGLYEMMPDWVRGFSGLQLPTSNIFLPRTPEGLSDETLADTAAFYSSVNVLYAIEIIHDRFPEGPEFLTRRNYQSLPPQLAMVLETLPQSINPSDTICIEYIKTVPALAAFCTILHAVFDFSTSDMLKLYSVAQIKDGRVKHYLAFLNEKPVGAGTMIMAEGIVSILNLCTLDSYRRRGIATNLLNYMLVNAHQQGCELAMLYSTAQAYQLFNNFGFEIYTQRQWFLPPNIDYEE